MPCDVPCMSYMALYLVSVHVIHTNSRTSTHWKLNVDVGKVQTASAAGGFLDGDSDDPFMNILIGSQNSDNGEWKLEDSASCKNFCKSGVENNLKEFDDNNNTKNTKASQGQKSGKTCKRKKEKKSGVECGKVVNTTEYDHLRGIADRKTHPHIPEPEVALIFKKKGKNTEIDMNSLEKQLKRAKKEKPKSPQVYNQIGNFWRIKGNTQNSIECFRKALSFSPDNPDVLLNLARVLFNLQYLDDAIFLTRRSLDKQPPEHNSWLQHFTLGEILKAYGHYQEATLHFKHVLELNPGFLQAEAHLREMEVAPDGTVTTYTLFIILFLVLGVICGILTTMDSTIEELGESIKTQRHFNRAMAMRSIKLGINPKLIRMRKQMNC